MPEQHYKRTHPLCHVPIIHPALLFDDCDSSFRWSASGTGADYTAEYDPAAAYVQTNGILLKTKQTAPAANDYVRIYRHLWLPPQMLLRLQLVFTHPNHNISAYLRFILHWYQGATHYVAGMRSQPDNGQVARATGLAGIEPTWTLDPELSVPLADGIWNKLDFSVNWKTHLHHLLHWNEHAVDLSDIPIPSAAGVAAALLGIYFELETLQAAQAEAHIDQILLTPENP